MNSLARLVLFTALATGASGVLAAEETVPAGSARCTVVDRSKAVALLACPADLSNEALREAGMAACHPTVQCRAWVWVDRTRIPVKAPDTDAEIPESARAHAVAIWVNQSQGLITLRRKTP